MYTSQTNFDFDNDSTQYLRLITILLIWGLLLKTQPLEKQEYWSQRYPTLSLPYLELSTSERIAPFTDLAFKTALVTTGKSSVNNHFHLHHFIRTP